MLRKVCVLGVKDGLRLALEDRLSRAGAKISEVPDEADFTIGISVPDSCQLAVMPPGSDSSNAEMTISLIDVIIPNGQREWGNGTLLDWIGQIKEGRTPEPENGDRFWVNVRDVVDAITVLSLSEGPAVFDGEIPMSGRRAWRNEDVVDEIRVLWERYSNAITHSHTVESLSGVPSPVRGIGTEKSAPPDLRPLHNALVESGGEGWHPLVPMRTSLMELIASTE